MNQPDDIASIAKRLREERERLSLTQAALASITLVSKLTQLKYESGQSTPGATYLAAFARLGADVLYVVTGDRTPEVRQMDGVSTTLSPEDAAILDHYHRSDEQDKAAVRRVLTALSSQGLKLNGPAPKPLPFPLRVDPHNRYASPDGVQPSPAQLDLRSPAAMFLAEQFDSVPQGARDVVHSLCIKLMRDYQELTETALIQWAERRAEPPPESPAPRGPTTVRKPAPALKK